MFCFPFRGRLGAVEFSKSRFRFSTENKNPELPKEKSRKESRANPDSIAAPAEDRFEPAQRLISAVKDLFQSGIKRVQRWIKIAFLHELISASWKLELHCFLLVAVYMTSFTFVEPYYPQFNWFWAGVCLGVTERR